MANKLAEVFVEVGAQTRPLDAALGGIRGRLGSIFSTPLSLPGGGLLGMLGLAGAGVGIAAFFGHAIDSAKNLIDTTNRTKAIFGDYADVVLGKADEMAAKYGVVKDEFISAATSFGAVFQGAGVGTAEAAKLGNQLAQLGMDMASFGSGVTNQEAFGALQAGLRGEFDPLERFNVFLSAADIGNRAMAMGLAKTKGEIDNHAKKMALLSLVMEQTAKQQGDLARTANDPANAARTFQGRVENLSATIGMSLMPAYKSLIGLGNEVMVDFTTAHEGMASTLDTVVGRIRSGIEAAGFIYRNFGDIIALAGVSIAEGITNVGEYFAYLGEVAGSFLDWFGANWSNVFVDSFHVVATLLANLGQNFMDFGKAAYDWIASGFSKGFDFKATGLMEGMPGLKTAAFEAPEMKPLSSFDDQRAEIGARINEREAARDARLAAMAGQEEAAKAAAAAAGPPGKLEKAKTAEIVSVSSIADSLAKAALGTKDPLLKEAQAQTTKLGEIAENTAKGAVARFAT